LLPSRYTCPRCQCHALCRVRRKGIDYLLSAIGLSTVRCLTCGCKSYMRLEERDRIPKPKRRAALDIARVTPVSAPAAPGKPRRAA
jgi:hypothetical protein